MTPKKRHFPALPERELLPNGTMFVTLKTLAELQEFWLTHSNQFQYAMHGSEDTIFPLGDYEWVFGADKAEVIETAMRWSESGIECDFYIAAVRDPGGYAEWLADREEHRAECIGAGVWDEAAERLYASVSESEKSGYWQLKNLPDGLEMNDWFHCLYTELTDSTTPIETAEKVLKEQTFSEIADIGWEELSGYDSAQLAQYIEQEAKDKAEGYEYYYGKESDTETDNG